MGGMDAEKEEPAGLQGGNRAGQRKLWVGEAAEKPQEKEKERKYQVGRYQKV